MNLTAVIDSRDVALWVEIDKKEFHVIMKHHFIMKKTTVEAKARLDKPYSDSTIAIFNCNKHEFFQRYVRVPSSTCKDDTIG